MLYIYISLSYILFDFLHSHPLKPYFLYKQLIMENWIFHGFLVMTKLAVKLSTLLVFNVADCTIGFVI